MLYMHTRVRYEHAYSAMASNAERRACSATALIAHCTVRYGSPLTSQEVYHGVQHAHEQYDLYDQVRQLHGRQYEAVRPGAVHGGGLLAVVDLYERG